MVWTWHDAHEENRKIPVGVLFSEDCRLGKRSTLSGRDAEAVQSNSGPLVGGESVMG